MATARSNTFNPDLDPNLLNWFNTAAGQYSGPYTVQLHSGYRPGDPRQHGKRNALDFRLIDPKTGKELNDYQDPKSYAEYQKLANLVRQAQMQANPEYNDRLRWGGYFRGGPGKYGALDLMHLDVGGGKGMGMLGGGWDTGASPEMAKLWGLPSGGGLTAQATAASAPVKAGPTSMDQYQRAILSAIRDMESSGRYDVITGGTKFTGDQHPNVRVPIGGPGGNYSTAAGAYQFITPTWDAMAKKLGLKDFSPASQDKAAWQNVLDTLGGQEGLNKLIAGGDPTALAGALGGQWEALKKDPKRFAELYQKALSGGAPAAPGTEVTTTPTAAAPQPAAAAPAAPKKSTWQDLIAKMSEGFGKATGDAKYDASIPRQPVTPTSMTPASMSPMLDAQAVQSQRDQLAQALARLNSGQLYNA